MNKLNIGIFLFFALVVSISFAQKKTDLDNIESDLKTAMEKSYETKTDEIQAVLDKISSVKGKKLAPWANYWMAYGKMMQSVFYASDRKNEEKMETAAKFAEESIALLEAIKKPNSEDLALLANVMGFSIQFNPGKGMVLGPKSGQIAEKAKKMDDNNLRAWLVLGTNDAFTPEQFGGGKKAEQYFITALTKKDKTIDLPYAPSWGKNQVYAMMAVFYKMKGRNQDAKNFLEKGLKAYPGDKMLIGIKESMEKKEKEGSKQQQTKKNLEKKEGTIKNETK